MKELECEVWCPRCKHYVGKVYRIKVQTGWINESEPKVIPNRCNICEQPVERHYAP